MLFILAIESLFHLFGGAGKLAGPLFLSSYELVGTSRGVCLSIVEKLVCQSIYGDMYSHRSSQNHN